jgi:antitoxin VapB
LPTRKTLDNYAMLVLCGRQKGLVCSITRLVHFGPLPEELKRKSEAVAEVDAVMIAATRPGATTAKIFEVTKAAYARAGYAEEYQLHHQGGAAGYTPREFLATSATDACIQTGQVYAWNPSISGVKSEDTILVGKTDNEILTAMEGWPVIPIEVEGHTLARPAILVVAD